MNICHFEKNPSHNRQHNLNQTHKQLLCLIPNAHAIVHSYKLFLYAVYMYNVFKIRVCYYDRTILFNPDAT